MKQHRTTMAALGLLLLLGCTTAPLPGSPTGSPATSASGAPAAPIEPAIRRDRVSTLPGPSGYVRDMFLDAQDRLHLVSDQAITRLDAEGRSTVVLRSTLPLDGPLEEKQRAFYYPLYATMAPDGSYYAFGLLGRLYHVAPDGRTLASYDLSLKSVMDADVVTDSKGNAYATVTRPDYGPDHPGRAWIAKLSPDGTVTPFAGAPDAPVGYMDATGTAARFAGASALAIDAFDNLYVADRGNYAIRRITPDGVVTTVAGKGPPMLPPSPMPGQPRPDTSPFYEGTVSAIPLAVDRAGDLFYATPDNRVWRVSADGEATLLAGDGRICQGPFACAGIGDCPSPPPADACYVDGPGAQAEFHRIHALVVSRGGVLHALDEFANGQSTRVRRIDWLDAPDPAVVRPGPLAIRTTRPAPPALGPDPTPTPPTTITTTCPPGQTCAELTGRVYDAAGRVVSEALEVSAAIVGHPETAVRLGTISNGSYRVPAPSALQPLELVIRGEATGTRRRPLLARRYDNGFNDGTFTPPTPTELDFGGPATSNDPDAPAFFLPERGRALGYASPPPPTAFESSTVTTLAGTGRDETFSNVRGLDVRPDGTVVVAGAQRNTLLSIAPSGTSVLAGGYEGEANLQDGSGADAHFFAPNDVALDADGNAYVADMSNCAIRRVTPDGTVTTIAGSRNYGYTDGQGSAARFHIPQAVAVDRAGVVYVADSYNHCIRAIAPTGHVSTYAGARAPGWANGPRAQARFRSPSELAFGPDGSLYVADSGNHRIRRIAPDGQVSDVYGAMTLTPDGTALYPAIAHIQNVVVDGAGDVFTADSERVYRIRPGGEVSILAGYGLSGFADGDARSAYFAGISGLGIDRNGSVYVSEYGNLRVRKITRP